MRREPGGLYTSVARLKSVVFSPDAIRRLEADGVTDVELQAVLEHGNVVRARGEANTLGLEHRGVRLVVRTRPWMQGAAAVCVDGYRVVE